MLRVTGFCVLLFVLTVRPIQAEEPESVQNQAHAKLVELLTPLLKIVGDDTHPYRCEIELSVPIDGKPQAIQLEIVRYDGESFDFAAHHDEYAVAFHRRLDQFAMVLPTYQRAYWGRGVIDASDHLAPKGLVPRILSSGTSAKRLQPFLKLTDPQIVAALIVSAADVEYDASLKTISTDDVTISLSETPSNFRIETPDVTATVSFTEPNQPKDLREALDAKGLTVSEEVSRKELEQQLCRGLRRTLEILSPSDMLKEPEQTPRKVENGELRWIDGHRVAILRGTPEQLGTAHGQLLKDEATHCIDSVLYAFGTVQTVRTGRWFRLDLEEAYARLAPHIPERHKEETRALAVALDLDPNLVETLNVFPELFHCSGFAVFDSATKDGTLYHGRVLDYMTAIGLQDAATTFIVAPEGYHAFANVGYGGFIGSVTGMNANAISLGEMGGRGEGQWDGVPMATLMRRALEECSTLDEVMTLWSESPRTCEYYYVFADGKTNEAVGVAATPEKIEFINPGEGHELLGDGIKDAVILSAGSRLEKLRERVTEKHGTIDEQTAIWLMSRPVAMQSNLHNALFVPAKGILYVANADHKHPAAERPYVRLDLNELLNDSTESLQPKSVMR